MSKVQAATALLEEFESGARWLPQDAIKLIVEIFEACGFPVSQQGFMEADTGVDCYVQANIEGKPQYIAVELKTTSYEAGPESVDQAFRLRNTGHFARSMIISRSGFSPAAIRRADTLGLGQIDLLGPTNLRNWLSKHSDQEDAEKTYASIVRKAMREIVNLIARNPSVLASIEWRELEKALREAFEGIGFETKLTRPSKDGGFDLELQSGGMVYLVEVKHWLEKKPGPAVLEKFVRVAVSEMAAAGLMLSTSGFSKSVYEGISAFSPPMHLGDGNKIISLCKTYCRLSSALWLEDVDLKETLFSDTQLVRSSFEERRSSRSRTR